MSLSNVTKSQFIDRSGSFSTRASRNGSSLLGWEEDENLTPEQERDCLKEHLNGVRIKHQNCTDKKEKKELGRLMADIALRMNKIRPKMRCPGIENYIIDILREDLTVAQFDILMKKAKRLHAKAMHEKSQIDNPE
jgi:hypothetical protein